MDVGTIRPSPFSRSIFSPPSTGLLTVIFGPENCSLPIDEAIHVNADGISPLHPPARHRKNLNYKKARRKDKKRKALPNQVQDKVDDKECKRQCRHDRGTLKERGRRGMNSDELAEVRLPHASDRSSHGPRRYCSRGIRFRGRVPRSTLDSAQCRCSRSCRR